MSLRTCLAPLVLVLMAAGCSLPQAAIPDGQPGSSGQASTSSPAPSSTTSPTGLALTQACELLTAQEATSLGVPAQGKAEKIAGLRRCDWTKPEGVVSTSINERRGIHELNLADASSITDVRIGRHRARRAVESGGPGYCDVFFAVGEMANISVSALYLNDTPRACAAADRAAALVEPKLP
jgi:uncharacterized protein DUF3558